MKSSKSSSLVGRSSANKSVETLFQFTAFLLSLCLKMCELVGMTFFAAAAAAACFLYSSNPDPCFCGAFRLSCSSCEFCMTVRVRVS